MTLFLALAIEQDYPAYAPYPLLSPLVGFADDTNLTVAHTPHEPHAPDPGPTVTQQANDLLDVTVSYCKWLEAQGAEGQQQTSVRRSGVHVSAASPICSDFQTFCPDWLHFGHFLCFGGIAASQLSLRIRPIYF